MKRRSKKSRRKVAKKCACRKPQRLDNMMLSTLKSKKNALEKAIAKKTSKLGVSKRTKSVHVPSYDNWSNL